MLLFNPGINELICEVEKITKDENSIFIMVGEKCDFDILALIKALNNKNISFFGGLFPAVIYDEEQSDKAVVIKCLPVKAKPYLIRGLGDDSFQIPEFEALEDDSGKKYTALILVDGLAPNIAGFLNHLFNRLLRKVTYIGGGAGSLSLEQQPCLFTPEGFFQDAALVTLLNQECKLGVRHGWKRVIGPVVATKTDKNKIIELNWQNAFEVYKEVVEKDSGKQLTADNFFDIAKGYPFGMLKEYSECIVRDPLAVTEKGELICVGEVPENTVLDILQGKEDSLIEAAGQAAQDCIDAATNKITDNLIADCISRVLFLEESFPLEINAVKQKMKMIDEELIPAGILTLGEISSYGEGFLEFFNKTIVVGVFHA
jgi:hypothetical protein